MVRSPCTSALVNRHRSPCWAQSPNLPHHEGVGQALPQLTEQPGPLRAAGRQGGPVRRPQLHVDGHGRRTPRTTKKHGQCLITGLSAGCQPPSAQPSRTGHSPARTTKVECRTSIRSSDEPRPGLEPGPAGAKGPPPFEKAKGPGTTVGPRGSALHFRTPASSCLRGCWSGMFSLPIVPVRGVFKRAGSRLPGPRGTPSVCICHVPAAPAAGGEPPRLSNPQLRA